MRWHTDVSSPEQCADAAAALVAALGVRRVEVVGHSYGTLVASAFVQRHARLVGGLALIDPVCLAMFLPTLLRTFLYAGPESGRVLFDTSLLTVSSELHCVAAFARCVLTQLWGEGMHIRAYSVVGSKGAHM